MNHKKSDGLNVSTEGKNPSIAVLNKGGRNPSLTADQIASAILRPAPPPAPPPAPSAPPSAKKK